MTTGELLEEHAALVEAVRNLLSGHSAYICEAGLTIQQADIVERAIAREAMDFHECTGNGCSTCHQQLTGTHPADQVGNRT